MSNVGDTDALEVPPSEVGSHDGAVDRRRDASRVPADDPGKRLAGRRLEFLPQHDEAKHGMIEHTAGAWFSRRARKISQGAKYALPTSITSGRSCATIRLSTAYQLSIAALLMGTIDATGHDLSPLAVLGAFGASQLAGAVPGPNGASPRDGALVAALMADWSSRGRRHSPRSPSRPRSPGSRRWSWAA